MRKRLLSVFIAVCMIAVLIVPVGVVRAQSSSSNGSSASDVIMNGLWAGINFIWPGSPNRSGSTTTGGSTSSSTNRQPVTTAPTPTDPQTAGAYIAMGDSVAAGVGLTTAIQVPQNEQRCERHSEAYPNQVSRSLRLTLVNITCSGATTRDFYTRDWSPSPSLPAQLDRAFATGTPRVITITTGANDIRWVDFLSRCLTTNCATNFNTDVVNDLLEIEQDRLVRVMNEIRSRSGTDTPPTVIITGYYNPVSASCTTIEPRATAEEITWITGGVDALNQTIRQVEANYSNVHFAPVNFAGHDICSSDSWVQGENDPRPFHPTATGHQAIAQSVIRTYNAAR